jgi:hypothetical protein
MTHVIVIYYSHCEVSSVNVEARLNYSARYIVKIF